MVIFLTNYNLLLYHDATVQQNSCLPLLYNNYWIICTKIASARRSVFNILNLHLKHITLTRFVWYNMFMVFNLQVARRQLWVESLTYTWTNKISICLIFLTLLHSYIVRCLVLKSEIVFLLTSNEWSRLLLAVGTERVSGMVWFSLSDLELEKYGTDFTLHINNFLFYVLYDNFLWLFPKRLL